MRFLLRTLKKWRVEQDGMAAVEAAMIFPIMLVLMMGVYDLGNAIVTNQKAIRASQVVADLISRNSTVSDADLNEAVEAGRLAFEPFDSSSYGVDIISIRFDEDAASEIVWRETFNMTPVADPLIKVDALSEADEGVMMIAVQYRFEPLFSSFAVGPIDMQEVAFSRGRRAAVVGRE